MNEVKRKPEPLPKPQLKTLQKISIECLRAREAKQEASILDDVNVEQIYDEFEEQIYDVVENVYDEFEEQNFYIKR